MRTMKKLCVKVVEVSEKPVSRMDQYRANKLGVTAKIIAWAVLVVVGLSVTLDIANEKLGLSLGGIPDWIIVWLPVLALTLVLLLDINDSVTQKFETPEEVEEANRRAIASVQVE